VLTPLANCRFVKYNGGFYAVLPDDQAAVRSVENEAEREKRADEDAADNAPLVSRKRHQANTAKSKTVTLKTAAKPSAVDPESTIDGAPLKWSCEALDLHLLYASVSSKTVAAMGVLRAPFSKEMCDAVRGEDNLRGLAFVVDKDTLASRLLDTHTRAHTHARTQAHTHARTQSPTNPTQTRTHPHEPCRTCVLPTVFPRTVVCSCPNTTLDPSLKGEHIHTLTHAQSQAHARAHTHARTHAHTHTHTITHNPTQTRTHPHESVRGVDKSASKSSPRPSFRTRT
jgi:hypothetical protein